MTATRPLDEAQQRVWLAEQFRPGTAGNLIVAAGSVDATLDVAQWRRAVQAAVGRHAELCHSYHVVGRKAVRRPTGADGIDGTVVDLRYLPGTGGDALAEVLAEQADTPFDLAAGIPLRWSLVLLSGRTVVVVIAHRIAIDEPTLGLLIRETDAAYQAATAGRPAALDGTAAVNESAAAADGTSYWRAVLSDLAPATLPTDRPRSPLPPVRGASVPVTIAADLVARARESAEAAGTNLTTVLLSGVFALLVRLGAGTDLAVNLAATGAGAHPYADDSQVIRADLAGDPDLVTVMARVHDLRMAAAQHGTVPFARLAAAVAPDSPHHDPFTSVALAVREQPLLPARLGGRELTPVDATTVGVRYELRLVLEPDPAGGLGGRLEYATDLFDEATARRFVGRYERLLAAGLAAPDRALSRLPLHTAAERETVLTTWNQTSVPYPHDRCLHDLIAEQARQHPQATAVVCGTASLTYQELDTRAERLAVILRERGAAPNRLVGVCAQRSVDTVVAIVAILKAGAAYVPLDPAYPTERLAFMLGDAAASVVITDAVAQPRLPACGGVVLRLDALPDSAAGTSMSVDDGAQPPAAAGPEDLCYVIYTSGSTGLPKGAANTHRGVINTMLSLISAVRLGSGTRLLQTSSLNFDMSAFDILSTLLAGGCLVVPEQHEATDPSRLLDLVHRQRVTVWSSTPALFKAVLDEALISGRELPTYLRTAFLGGDRFPLSVPATLAELAPWCQAWNTAGMTEVSFTTTLYRVQPGDGRRTAIPWGRPLANQRVYVLDEHGEPVPPGAPGELYIGGAGVGWGYWNRPELTQERFLPDPFDPRPGARMYRTGDRVRQLTDGGLDFLGRLDHQIKIRGYRVELGEVEAAIAQHPRVRDAVAAVRNDSVSGERLVAYVVSIDGAPAGAVEELRAFLADRLPEHMIPGVFVPLPRIPLTANGKVDRGALDSVAVPAMRPNLATLYVPGRDEIECKIIEVWSQVLGVEAVGGDDEFAALGGHSLIATPMMAMLSGVLGLPLSARDLFEATTPAKLAERARQRALDAADG